MGKNKAGRKAVSAGNRAGADQQKDNGRTHDPYRYVKLLAALACILVAAALLLHMNSPKPPTGQITGETQVVRMAVGATEYTPSVLTVEAGRPVRWVVDGSKSSGCTSVLVFREFGITRRLDRGENIIEFTPTEKGTYTFTCGMAMVRGTMNVV